MRNAEEQKLYRKQNIDFMSSNPIFFLLFFFESRAGSETMWENMVQPERPQMTV